jgi:integrase
MLFDITSLRTKLARGHHAAMPYEDVAAFIAKLRKREATSALALELCILTAARSGEILGMRWSEIDLDKKIWTVPADRMKAGANIAFPCPRGRLQSCASLRSSRRAISFLPGRRATSRFPNGHKNGVAAHED